MGGTNAGGACEDQPKVRRHQIPLTFSGGLLEFSVDPRGTPGARWPEGSDAGR